jgi:dTDP-4-amino-4,6-dideoxygalactose transaminase
MPIPFVDLTLQNREVGEEVRLGIDEVIASSAFILGPQVVQFERDFAAFCEARHCVGVANGTDALELMCRAAGIGPGHEVIVPVSTFVATALAVARTGATPVFVDVDPVHNLIDPDRVRSRIGPLTRAIIAVHLYGQIAPMEELEEIARETGLLLLEDAAQAQGARRNGRAVGSIGAAAATSFYPSKNLGAYGDAGAVLTNDDGIGERVRRLRNYGGEQKYDHPETGFNSRLDTLQAVVLLAKLKRLPDWTEDRRRAAARYHRLLEDLPQVTRPETLHCNEHVWHLYVIRVRDRDRVLRELHTAGIAAAVHYPDPCHLLGAFGHLGHKPGDFPVAEQASREVLSLPIYPGITEAQQAQVVEALAEALR